MSHELNQPLAAIHNFVQAARNLARKDEAEAKVKLDGMLEKALGQAERGSSILRGMREVVERGEVSTEEIDINRLMLDAVDLAEEGGSLAGIQVGLALAAGLPPVLANPVQIHQVMINLIQNAGEAMADADPKELTVATKSAGPDMVEVSVSDRGPGLPDEVAVNLFKPFVTTKPSGMGLGLSICRAIVEAHGGRLSADRRDGGGTVFRFTLPVAMEGVGPEAESPSEP